MKATVETLPALLDALVDEHGDREAVISGRGRLSFRDLGALTDRVAAALAARGVGQGTHVGLLLPNWPEWLALAFGVWRCGGVLVPINTLYRARELEHALTHADVSLLIAARGFLRHDYAAALAELGIGASGGSGAPALREVVLLDSDAPLDLAPLLGGGSADPGRGPGPDDVATIVFTSGSTAAPKGVVHTHRALRLAAAGDASVLGIGPDDRTWGYLPFFFAGGLVAVALATLSRGAAIVLQDVFEPGRRCACSRPNASRCSSRGRIRRRRSSRIRGFARRGSCSARASGRTPSGRRRSTRPIIRRSARTA